MAALVAMKNKRYKRNNQLFGIITGLIFIFAAVFGLWIYYLQGTWFGRLKEARVVELETFIDDERVMAKFSTVDSESKTVQLTFDGGPSSCSFIRGYAPVITDVRGKLLTPVFNPPDESGRSDCVMDLKFLFTRFRTMTLSKGSVEFSNDALTEGTTCKPTMSNTGRGLCEMQDPTTGVQVYWFSDAANSNDFYDSVSVVSLEIANKDKNQTTSSDPTLTIDLLPKSFSRRVPDPIVDANIPHILDDHVIVYDIQSERLAVYTRPTSRLMIDICAILSLLTFLLLVIKLSYVDVYVRISESKKHRISIFCWHWIAMFFCVGATVIALASRSRSLSNGVFIAITITTTAIHCGIEVYRSYVHSVVTFDTTCRTKDSAIASARTEQELIEDEVRDIIRRRNAAAVNEDATSVFMQNSTGMTTPGNGNHEEEKGDPFARAEAAVTRLRVMSNNSTHDRAIVPNLDMKPDVSLVMVALVTTTYVFTSHSLVFMPAMAVLVYTVLTVSETVNSGCVVAAKSTHTVVVYAICMATDIGYSIIGLQFIVQQFVEETLVADPFLQTLLLMVLVILAGGVIARMRFKSVILPSFRTILGTH